MLVPAGHGQPLMHECFLREVNEIGTMDDWSSSLKSVVIVEVSILSSSEHHVSLTMLRVYSYLRLSLAYLGT